MYCRKSSGALAGTVATGWCCWREEPTRVSACLPVILFVLVSGAGSTAYGSAPRCGQPPVLGVNVPALSQERDWCGPPCWLRSHCRWQVLCVVCAYARGCVISPPPCHADGFPFLSTVKHAGLDVGRLHAAGRCPLRRGWFVCMYVRTCIHACAVC
jgi:hypothetical protein